MHRPQNVTSEREAVHVALVYKNFAAGRGISHIGLGVAALNTSVTLRRLGHWVDVWPCNTCADVIANLEAARERALARAEHPISHVIISAPWIPAAELQSLLMKYPEVNFVVVSHSNIGFLMADPNGIRLLRQAIELEAGHHNFALGGNSKRFVQAWTHMYGARMTYLPNLYDISSIRHEARRHWTPGKPLRVGVFGATRPLKNMVSAVAAAVQLGASLHNDVEIWLSTGRDDSGGTVKRAILQIVDNLPHTKLIESPWRPWPKFRDLVRDMDILLSPSYTESFCMVVADGVAEGIPSVVSTAITWAPHDWMADADDVTDIARTARRLLCDDDSISDGEAALRQYVLDGSRAWEHYLAGGL